MIIIIYIQQSNFYFSGGKSHTKSCVQVFVSVTEEKAGHQSQLCLFSPNPYPRMPGKCDPDLSFDAVTDLQQRQVCKLSEFTHRSRQTDKLLHVFRFLWRKHPQSNETGITVIISLWPDPDSVPPFLNAAYKNVEIIITLHITTP